MLLVEDLGRAFRCTDSGFQAQCIVYSLGLGCKRFLTVCVPSGLRRAGNCKRGSGSIRATEGF